MPSMYFGPLKTPWKPRGGPKPLPEQVTPYEYPGTSQVPYSWVQVTSKFKPYPIIMLRLT